METNVGTNSYAPKTKSKRLQQFCIAIPAYKEELNIDEIVSLERLHKVLKDKSNVYLFCPIELNISKYKEIFPELQVMEFEPENFTSIDAYSHLCMKYEFYDAFSMYEYMIIYQLDCYLLDDNIARWCEKDYDYIGAPIMVPHDDWKNYRYTVDKQIVFSPSVGNGGFSLRKISTFKFLTNPNGELRKRYDITDEKLKEIKFEDVYFCVDLGALYEIERPKFQEALEFAIDMNPDIVFDQYKFDKMPMCIHAFDKNIPYWRDKIEDFDNDELYDYCVEKNKDFIDKYYFKKDE